MDKRRKIVVDHTKYVRHLVPLFEKEGLGEIFLLALGCAVPEGDRSCLVIYLVTPCSANKICRMI